MVKLYNSLSRQVEDFTSIKHNQVGFYTCGPTVYSFAHIGNFRTYTTADLLIRALQYQGYNVKYVMNLTDVGHLTGDNLGDADTGEDRMEKAAQKEGKTAWEIAQFYADVFKQDYEKLHLTKPERFCKATDHIKEQIDLVKKLEQRGFTYQTSDGIYFDTTKFPSYGELSNLDEIKEGARVAINEEKKNPRDFALWKFSPTTEKRQMEWKSPWGKGFPGWHIECSAMSMKYLGETFDLHAGGMDLKETHHPNEIAQSEAATGKKFVNYWIHSAFMLVDGERMSKSKGNNYKVYDLEKQGYDPLALRYLYMQTHYRQEMNFTLPALEAAQNALTHLREEAMKLGTGKVINKEFEEKFLAALNDDLNMPQAVAVIWELLKSDLPATEKGATLFKFDTILGFNLAEYKEENKDLTIDDVPLDIRNMIQDRNALRKQGSYAKADQLRNRLKKFGYDIQDVEGKTQIRRY